MSNPADIPNATSSTYTLVTADLGKKIRVQVNFTDDDNHDEELTSAAYPASGTVAAAPTPNLTVGSPSVTNNNPEPGEVFTLSATVTNTGDKDAPATTLWFYQSTDTTITTSDPSPGTEPVGALTAGATSPESKDVTAPATAGTYYYGACVDPVPNETNTANNCSQSVQVTVTARPNLTVDLPSVNDLTPETGGVLLLATTVTNRGSADADATTLRFYQSTDAAITMADAEVDTDPVVPLRPLASSVNALFFTAPATAGTYYYGACVDPVPNETNTTNNCSQSVQVTVTAAPNLTVGSPSVTDSTPQPGGVFTLSVTVRNDGSADADATTLRFYQSTDATITMADTEVDTEPVGALAAGATSPESKDVTAPLTPATYYYGACVDPVPNERTTTNNCSMAATVSTDGGVPPPPPPPPSPGGGGGGPPSGGGPRQTVPDAPRNLLADATDGAVTLMWEAPEDDGGAVITDYEYRIDQRGDWISIGSTATTHTVAGLVNGTAYVFQVRAVNRVGRSGPSLSAEATPIAQVVLDLAHFANGAGIISEVVLVNVAPHPIQPALYFYDQEGEPIAAESMVDVLGDLEITEDGALSIQSEMEPLGELTISTHGRGDLVSGSVKVAAYGTIGGVLRFDLAGIGVAGVQVSQTLRDAIFPVRRREGGINTGMALHNREEEAAGVSCRLMKNGAVLDEVEITLAANGQVARFIGEVFTGTDTSDFVGLVRCTAEGVAQFTGMALELDAGNRIFTTLPVVEVNRGRAGEEALDFAHFANGASIVSEMVFMNLETQPSGPPPTPFHQAIPPTRPVIYFYDQEGNPIDPALLVDLTGDLEITEDGALSIQSEMEPLGELTISTHGRGELVSGSVRVVSDGPIGGVLRFDIPGIGVAGVGASQPVRDAIFPARRQAGGISTAAAIHNLGEEALVVGCQLMKDGAILEEEEIPLAANGQEARFIEELFTSTDTSDFVGSVRCTAPGLFTGVAVELDAGNRIFTTLPVVAVPERMSQE